MAISFKIETDPAKGGANPLVGSPKITVGASQLTVGGVPIPGTTATSKGPELPTVIAAYGKDGTVTVQVGQNMANPLAPASQGIRSDLTLTTDKDASKLSINGTISGSPSFEVNTTVQNGQTVNTPIQENSGFAPAFVAGLEETVEVHKDTDLKPPKEERH